MKRVVVNSDRRQQKHRCEVCGLPTFSFLCGVAVCEACKKFYIRNRDNLEKLSCINKLENCGNTFELPDTTTHLVVRRQFCPKCRLKKCFELGLRKVYKKTSPMSRQQKNNSLVAQAPLNYECLSAESILKQTVAATTDFCVFESLLVNRGRTEIFKDDRSFWLYGMRNFELMAAASLKYVDQLGESIARQMPIEDRRQLVLATIGSNGLIQLCLPKHKEYRFFGMPDAFRRLFVASFPISQPVDEILTKVADVIGAWNPTFAEYSLLQALVLFRVGNAKKATNQSQILKLHNNLRFTFESFLSQNGSAYRDSRISWFNLLNVLLLEYLNMCRHGIAKMAQTHQVSLFRCNELFSDVYLEELSALEEQQSSF